MQTVECLEGPGANCGVWRGPVQTVKCGEGPVQTGVSGGPSANCGVAWRAWCKLWCVAGRVQTEVRGGGPEQVRKAQGREASAGRSAAGPRTEAAGGEIWERVLRTGPGLSRDELVLLRRLEAPH